MSFLIFLDIFLMAVLFSVLIHLTTKAYRQIFSYKLGKVMAFLAILAVPYLTYMWFFNLTDTEYVYATYEGDLVYNDEKGRIDIEMKCLKKVGKDVPNPKHSFVAMIMHLGGQENYTTTEIPLENCKGKEVNLYNKTIKL